MNTDFTEIKSQVESLDKTANKWMKKETARLDQMEHVIASMRGPEGGTFTGGTQRGVYNSLGDQLRDVVIAGHPGTMGSQRADALGRLGKVQAAATGASEGVASDGGFLVQTDFASLLDRGAVATGQLSKRCFQVPISGNANGVSLNLIDETNRATGSRYGGIQVYWTAEAGQLTPKKPTFRHVDLKLKKLTGLFYATDEIVQDSNVLTAMVNKWFPMEFGFAIDDAIIHGTGAGQPLGLLNAGCKIEVAKETGQAAATIVFENIVKMYSRLLPGSEANAAWLINRDIIPSLYTMNLAVGTGGVPVFMPANQAAGRPFQTLMGLPLLIIEQAETLGTAGDIILADLSQYALATKGGIQQATSIHVQFIYDEMVFRWTYRVDGSPLHKAALTPYKGTGNTQSPFITLATRS